MRADVQRQRDYYTMTAKRYDALHVKPADEHERALAAFLGLAEIWGEVGSALDVGAGTGRGVRKMTERWPKAHVIGIEPVAALREVGYASGLSRDRLLDGDALQLPFEDNSFDFVTETGVLHHISQPLIAVKEMVRVARKGVMISDNNHIGGGSSLSRHLKFAAKSLGLMKPIIWFQTGGKMFRVREGDGVFYTFTAFDCIIVIKEKFNFIQVMNTRPAAGFNPYRTASHVMLFASKS
jgi:ubiquinone/menaquinone biosynthesis C-methylase UbiE